MITINPCSVYCVYISSIPTNIHHSRCGRLLTAHPLYANNVREELDEPTTDRPATTCGQKSKVSSSRQLICCCCCAFFFLFRVLPAITGHQLAAYGHHCAAVPTAFNAPSSKLWNWTDEGQPSASQPAIAHTSRTQIQHTQTRTFASRRPGKFDDSPERKFPSHLAADALHYRFLGPRLLRPSSSLCWNRKNRWCSRPASRG